MKSTSSKARIHRYISEDKKFWQNHISGFSTSGVQRRAYCQKHSVDYNRFSYWIKRLNKDSIAIKKRPASTQTLAKTPPITFLPVQLKTQSSEASRLSGNIPALATMNFKNGHVLHIHHEQALLIILERCV